jgi:Fic family protein
MNETILDPRQRFLLNVVSGGNGLSREQIQDKIKHLYSVSKPTLIRDVNTLLARGLIRTQGTAKATRYYPATTNPLLRPFDLKRYFADDLDQRPGAKHVFDASILGHLHGLFLPNERGLLRRYSSSFTQRTKQLPADIVKREMERFVIELSWKSSKIEGNTYTLLETEALIKEKKEAVGRSRQEAVMILNHKAAFEQILLRRSSFRMVSLSDVNQLHGVLVQALGVDTGIRKNPVGITGTVYRPLDNQHQILEMYQKTLDIINRATDPFEKALIAHVMIPYVQPYADGNKRTARMLTNALLLAHDLFPLSYRSVDEEEFKQALILFYEQGSLYHSKRLFIEQVKFSQEHYFRS